MQREDVGGTRDPFEFYGVANNAIETRRMNIDDRAQLIHALASCREANANIRAIAEARKLIITHRDDRIQKLEREIIKDSEREEQLMSEIRKLHDKLNQLETENETE